MDERRGNNIGPDETNSAGPEAALDYPWVLFGVEGVTYGIYSTYVLSIEILGEVTPLVDTPAYMRGVTNFRGDMIQLIDLRSLFGLPNRAAELRGIIQPKLEPLYKETTRLLAETVAVFEEGNREMLVVLERDGVVRGMIVDDIVSVEFINDRLEMTAAQGARSQYVRKLGRRGQGGATVLMMNEETLFSV
jgi:chemotaxis signal transduction protein